MNEAVIKIQHWFFKTHLKRIQKRLSSEFDQKSEEDISMSDDDSKLKIS